MPNTQVTLVYNGQKYSISWTSMLDIDAAFRAGSNQVLDVHLTDAPSKTIKIAVGPGIPISFEITHNI